MAKVFGKKKVVVVGDGRVGSSAVFALFQQPWINEVGVIDVVLPGHKDENGEWVKGFNAMHNVEGDALDMNMVLHSLKEMDVSSLLTGLMSLVRKDVITPFVMMLMQSSSLLELLKSLDKLVLSFSELMLPSSLEFASN